jgi:hypothetical protein
LKIWKKSAGNSSGAKAGGTHPLKKMLRQESQRRGSWRKSSSKSMPEKRLEDELQAKLDLTGRLGSEGIFGGDLAKNALKRIDLHSARMGIGSFEKKTCIEPIERGMELLWSRRRRSAV